MTSYYYFHPYHLTEQLQYHITGNLASVFAPYNLFFKNENQMLFLCSELFKDFPSLLAWNLNSSHFLTRLYLNCLPHLQPLSPCLLVPATLSAYVCPVSQTHFCFKTFVLAAPSGCNIPPSHLCTSLTHSFASSVEVLLVSGLPSPPHLKKTHTNTPHPHSCTIPVCPFTLFFFIPLNNIAENVSLPSRISARWWSQLYILCNAHST